MSNNTECFSVGKAVKILGVKRYTVESMLYASDYLEKIGKERIVPQTRKVKYSNRRIWTLEEVKEVGNIIKTIDPAKLKACGIMYNRIRNRLPNIEDPEYMHLFESVFTKESSEEVVKELNNELSGCEIDSDAIDDVDDLFSTPDKEVIKLIDMKEEIVHALEKAKKREVQYVNFIITDSDEKIQNNIIYKNNLLINVIKEGNKYEAWVYAENIVNLFKNIKDVRYLENDKIATIIIYCDVLQEIEFI